MLTNYYGNASEQVALLTSATGLRRCDFVVHHRGGRVNRIDFGNPAFDPTYYVMLFPYGDAGWSAGLHQSPRFSQIANVVSAPDLRNINPLGDARRRCITAIQHYAYRLQWRRGAVHTGDRCLMMGGRLLQEYCCTAYARAEAQRLQFQRNNQAMLRCDTIANLRTARSEASAANQPMPACGRAVRLASSFVGGPRDVHNRYLDAMAVVGALRKPSLFITMTCNPKWPQRFSNPYLTVLVPKIGRTLLIVCSS